MAPPPRRAASKSWRCHRCAGSTMWCTWRPARRHVRTDVPELARPPWRRATTTSAVAGSAAQSGAMPDGPALVGRSRRPRRPLRGSPVPPSRHRRDPRRGTVGRQGLGRGAEVEDHASGARRSRSGPSSRQRHPGTGRGMDGRGLAGGTSSKSRWSPRPIMAAPTVGSTAPSVNSAARRAAATASASNRLTATGRPWACPRRGTSIRPEPAAGPVDGVELVAQDFLGQVDRLTARRHHHRRGPERRESAGRPAALLGRHRCGAGHLSSPPKW